MAFESAEATQAGIRRLLGWIAVGLSTLISCAWAAWGIIENFHEGWYFESLPLNIGLMMAQYLSPMLVFVGLGMASAAFPRLGAILHIVLALCVAIFFDAFKNTVILLLIIPLVGLGLLFAIGTVRPVRHAFLVQLVLPVLALAVFGVSPAVRVAHRYDDGILLARAVQGNGVDLVWAPAGPGWPKSGGDWFEAQQTCRRLNSGGRSFEPSDQGIWRLPTIDEAVRSMTRGGLNSGGEWDVQTRTASYANTPDKESPLWNVYSQVIYWWTATSTDRDHAFIIAYDGNVWQRSKTLGTGDLGFRCVKEEE